jgi:hypothetical protein
MLLGLMVMGLNTACVSDPKVERQGGAVPSASNGGDASSSDSSDSGTPVTFCAAFEVVAAKCQRCHGDPLALGAPVAFLSAADFHRLYGQSDLLEYWEVAIDQVDSGRMPYVAANEPPTSAMPPVEALTRKEKVTLLDWLKQGATEEGGTDCP